MPVRPRRIHALLWALAFALAAHHLAAASSVVAVVAMIEMKLKSASGSKGGLR